MGIDLLEKSKPKDRSAAFAALRYRDFRLLWMGQIVSVTGSQMQMVAIHWHVYLLTKSPFALGLVGLFRGAPLILCSLFGGVIADAVDRKRLMIFTQSILLACAGLLTIFTIRGLVSPWPIYALTGIASMATAFDLPARQALMPMLVPPQHFANSVSLGMIVFNLATIIGPALAGLALASHGPAFVYALNAASFIAVIVALLAMRVTGSPGETEGMAARVGIDALKEGIVFVWQTPIIVQTMTLDFAATFFASANALLPIFAEEVLRVGARGLGFLAAAPAVGSVITALVMARIGTFRNQGRVVISAVLVFGLATVGFGLSKLFWLSLLMLAISGAADTVSTVLRNTIRQLTTPNHLRGRMTSINMVFFMGGPQLGEVEAGAVAAWIGAPLAVFVGGVGSIASAVLAATKAKALRSYTGETKS